MNRLISIWLAVLFGMLALAVQASEVRNVRVWQAPDNTRLVFDLDGPVEYSAFMVENPYRLVIDLKTSTTPFDLAKLDLQGSIIQSVRSGVQNGRDLRLVLDLSKGVPFRHFTLAPNQQYGHRLVLDLLTGGEEEPAAVAAKPSAEPSQPSAEPSKASGSNGATRDIIIAIDAGHGGEDPGAIGPGGVREKVVVLAIAKELAALLEREPGFKPVLIRKGDYYIELRKRTRLARQSNADLFVSVHADAFNKPSARGASVWTLSERGATSEMGRWLAQTENNADLIGGVGNVSLENKDEVLAGVLLDLSMSGTLKLSDQVGKDVLRSMGGVARLHKNHVERAGFVVLKSPDIPSLLIETGFISNPGEAALLKDPAYQRKMANAIFQGIRKHFYDAPPPQTWVAAKVNGTLGKVAVTEVVSSNRSGSRQKYKVMAGDTLSAIAAKNGISLSQLLRENDLNSNSVIKVGQVLYIPPSS